MIFSCFIRPFWNPLSTNKQQPFKATGPGLKRDLSPRSRHKGGREVQVEFHDVEPEHCTAGSGNYLVSLWLVYC